MNKKNVIIGSLIALVVIYLLGVFLFTQKVMPNTKFSDNPVTMINKSSLDKVVKENFAEQTIAIKDDVLTDYTPKISDLGASIDAEALAIDIEQNQNPWKWPINFFTDQNYDLTQYIEVDEGQMNGRLISDKLLDQSERTKSVNAKVYFDDKSGLYAIKPEVNGTIISDDFNTELATAIKNGETEFDATKYYKQPKVVSTDLEKNRDALNSRLERKMTVTFGSDTVTIPSEDVATFIFLDDEGNIDVDNTALYNYLSALAIDHNSVSTAGGKRVATAYSIDKAYYRIEEQLLSDSTDDINVESTAETFNQQAGQVSTPSSSTYIEVSISQQYMWVYNSGELIVGTPVVTGNESDGRGTPRGTFSVWNKETDKVLDGSTVGYDYLVPVDYWMAIDYTGVGIHDIDYLTSANAEEKSSNNSLNGSHGCINTPDDLMETVYNNTPLGTPVYVVD